MPHPGDTRVPGARRRTGRPRTPADELRAMRRWMLAAAVALAALLPIDGPKDWLVLPARNLHALRVVACDDACRVHRELPLSGRLHSNVAAVPAAGNAPGALWAADDGGAIHRFDLEPGRDGDLGEHGPDVQRVR